MKCFKHVPILIKYLFKLPVLGCMILLKHSFYYSSAFTGGNYALPHELFYCNRRTSNDSKEVEISFMKINININYLFVNFNFK